jgi:release factor glutamine methyltransferase
MSAPPLSTAEHSAVVARLRAAGCVFAEDEADLLVSTARTPAELAVMVDRRVTGLPLEHVLGWAEFCGLRIAVDPGVFVPRRRTEFMVGEAAALARAALGNRAAEGGARGAVVVVDLCCGTGAVGAALVHALGFGSGVGPGSDGVELHAADIDPAAVACARRNVAAAAVAGRVYVGDLFAPLPETLRGRVDVLVANVPYVPTGDVELLPAEARDHEPRVALDGGPDGLDVLRRVAAEAPAWLAPGGHLLVETSERQVSGAVAVFADAGLAVRVAEPEELYATVLIGERPA